MTTLGLDIGSSSVKAGLLRGDRVVGEVVRVEIQTRYDGVRAQIEPDALLRAVGRAIGRLPRKPIDLIALSVMSPAWVAMDRDGNALTPIITHQDRRSVEIARDIERAIGKARHLKLAGNRPFPGGISSTTCGWFLRHQRSLMRRADLVGHLNTFLHRRLTGARLVDPSNASFMGLYRTLALGGWSEALCDAVGIARSVLPEIRDANEIGGRLTGSAAHRLGLRQGTPMLVGLTDTGSALLLAGATPGRLLNVSGSTDVLALCTDRPRPHERLLTRALGMGRLWLSVSTIAAAGSSISWLKEQLFADLSWPQFKRVLARVARSGAPPGVVFEPYLAGERTAMQQRSGAFRGLTLSTTRKDLLAAAVDALARASAERFELLSINRVRMHRHVLVSGGVADALQELIRRRWPGQWSFQPEREAALRGLGHLQPS